MQKQEWIQQIQNEANELHISLSREQTEQFFNYMQLILEWNEKINLTAITEPTEILQKHFIDSLTIYPYLTEKRTIIDVGTGAGFPGIPLKIVNPNHTVVLLDSLNKRLNFLQEVIKQLKLKKIETIHARAEEGAKNKQYREMFDIATSRAVAPLNILVEYLLPFVKLGGRCIAMKGNNTKEEIQNSQKAIEILGGQIEKVEEFRLPNSEIQRTVILIKKVKKTPEKYPRKAGIPSKEPIL